MNKKIIDYKIHGYNSANLLSLHVRLDLQEDWHLYGHPYVRVWEDGADEVFHYQAMVKYEDEQT